MLHCLLLIMRQVTVSIASLGSRLLVKSVAEKKNAFIDEL